MNNDILNSLFTLVVVLAVKAIGVDRYGNDNIGVRYDSGVWVLDVEGISIREGDVGDRRG